MGGFSPLSVRSHFGRGFPALRNGTIFRCLAWYCEQERRQHARRIAGIEPGSLRWTPQESQVERREHQDDSNIYCQPLPESISEKHEIYTDYDGCHRHNVKPDSYLSTHFNLWLNRNSQASVPPCRRSRTLHSYRSSVVMT
jgi:hypothetical protein